MSGARAWRGTLFRKYAVYFSVLVTAVLAASGLVELVFSYNDARTLVEQLQREKAHSARLSIEQFVAAIEAQMRAALRLADVGAVRSAEERQQELLRLLQQAPAVVDLVWVSASGYQLVKVSRLARDEFGSGPVWSSHPGFAPARQGALYGSPVYFRDQSEPYMTLAVGSADGVIFAQVNLKLVWRVVSAAQPSAGGAAYVVDVTGRLIAHPDNSLVLRKTDLSALSQVSSAMHEPSGGGVSVDARASNGTRRETLSAHEAIPALGWHVFIEQSLSEVFQPLYASAKRALALLIVGVGVAVAAAMVLARRMTAPIEVLKEGASRIGRGQLHERVQISTGDELQQLADEFNGMASRLRESRDGMESTIAQRTRELAAANQAKSRFLAVASHDLRQPAHALSLFLAQLRGVHDEPERQRLLARVEASSGAISDLLDALLDVSRLDAGSVTPRLVDLQLQDLLDRVEQDFALTAQAKGLRLRVRPSPLRVLSDADLLQRILVNLIGNAVRYTREGGVLVACRRRGAAVRIEVWDTGIGIPADHRDRVFDEFHQAHMALGEPVRGLGLGLAIVKRLAGLLGITVVMHSQEGHGTVFLLTLPIQDAVINSPATAMAPPQAIRFDGALALVVDDNAEAREAVAGLLRQWGWRVLAAEGGDAAMAALAAEPALPELVICDHHLGSDERGPQVIERVRARTRRDLPAVLVSGHVDAELHQAAAQSGLHVLHKPLQAARLRVLLHHLCSPSP